jgi:PAS domain S-box-containing protein
VKDKFKTAPSKSEAIRVSNIHIEWKLKKGTCTFEKLPVAMMWVDTTLAGVMSGVQAMVGTKRFNLALQSEGRKSVEDDWKVISSFPKFKDGFKAIANIAAVAGWGEWKLVSLNEEKKECSFRIKNSWEGRYQKALGECWGSGMLAGKMAGYCSMLFRTNCWAEQTAFIARGDKYDEFIVRPSKRSLEKEIGDLLTTDEATRADMAVALEKLRIEITERERTEKALRESEQRLARSQEIAHLGSWELDLLRDELTWSDEVYRIFGLQPQEFRATYSAFLERVYPDDRLEVDAAYSGSIKEGRDSYEIKHRVVRNDTGEIRWVHEKCQHMRDAAGRFIRSLGMVQDITEQKHAEEELRKLTEGLKRSNAELEQFAYSASHDMREPLRTITGFLRLLEKRYKGKLDEKANEYIDFTIEGVTRLDALLKDMAEFSRLDIRASKFKPVNASVALEQAIYDLRSAIGESGTEITYDLLPTVLGNESQMTRLFQNLISNSIKFRSKKKLRIHLSAEQKGNVLIFSVRDNGIGIDPKYFERIFIVFQRLHTREEYAGTGMGLAMCKKIVELHGGKIWIESEPGKGATFYFTLPVLEASAKD